MAVSLPECQVVGVLSRLVRQFGLNHKLRYSHVEKWQRSWERESAWGLVVMLVGPKLAPHALGNCSPAAHCVDSRRDRQHGFGPMRDVWRRSAMSSARCTRRAFVSGTAALAAAVAASSQLRSGALAQGATPAVPNVGPLKVGW